MRYVARTLSVAVAVLSVLSCGGGGNDPTDDVIAPSITFTPARTSPQWGEIYLRGRQMGSDNVMLDLVMKYPEWYPFPYETAVYMFLPPDGSLELIGVGTTPSNWPTFGGGHFRYTFNQQSPGVWYIVVGYEAFLSSYCTGATWGIPASREFVFATMSIGVKTPGQHTIQLLPPPYNSETVVWACGQTYTPSLFGGVVSK